MQVQARLRHRVEDRLGGRARAKVIAVLAAVVGLESADVSTVGAAAPQIEHAFRIGHTQLGLLASVSLAVGALATIPFGILADRVSRTRVLAVVVALWSVALVAAGSATSYGSLLAARVGLGAVTAAAFPIVASLIGDLFDPEERGRIYSLILTGEFVGAAFGVMVSGNLAALSWRYAFWSLVVPGLVLSWLLARHLSEPARGGASRLPPPGGRRRREDRHGARDEAAAQGIEPDPDRVIEPRGDDSLPSAVRDVLSVPTNRTLIVASAVGYFFFAGLRTFAVSFLRTRFGVAQSTATTLLVMLGIGGIAGAIIAGRVADRMLERGRLDGRIVVPVVAYFTGAALLLPGLLVASLPIAMTCYVLGAGSLAGANPPLDAARLDIMPSRLWGRAESVRTVLRQAAQASSPLLFGAVADAPGGSGGTGVQDGGGPGLRYAFLIMLTALVASGAVVWTARRRYPIDVATAAASDAQAGG